MVFVAIVVSGVSFTQPTPLDIANWRGEFGPITISGRRWRRLLTSYIDQLGIRSTCSPTDQALAVMPASGQTNGNPTMHNI